MGLGPDAFRAFTVQGNWWIPGRESQPIGGTLFYSPMDGFRLELSGTLTGIDVRGPGRREILRHNPKRILGNTGEGAVTLHDAHCINVNTSHSRNGSAFTVTKYVAMTLFAGRHLEYEEEPTFASMSIGLTSLEEWLGAEVCDYRLDADSELVKLVDPPTFVVVIEEPPMKIETSGWRSGPASPSHHQVLVEGGSTLVVTPAEPQSLSFFDKVGFCLQNMLTVMTASAVTTCRRTGHLVDDDPRMPTLAVISAPGRTSPEEPPNPFNMPFVPSETGVSFAQSTERWFRLVHNVKEVTELLSATKRTSSLMMHVHFTFLVQALESFHRQAVGGQFMTPSSYAAVEQAIIAAIPVTVQQAHRDALKSKIKFGNEISLAKRLDNLWSVLPLATRDLLHPGDPGPYLRRIKDTRNFFAHHDPSIQKMTDDEIARSLPRLEAFLLAVLAKHMGYDDDAAHRFADITMWGYS